MQELMSRHKAYALNPRDCLKTTLFQKWQKMVAPPGKINHIINRKPLCNTHVLEASKPANKRRKRKGSSAAASEISLKKGVSRPNFSLASQVTDISPWSLDLSSHQLFVQDVMIVGEPSLMGGDFGEEDERLITRLENTQYDPMGQPIGPGLEAGDPGAPYQGGSLPPWTGPGPPPVSQELDIKQSPPNS